MTYKDLTSQGTFDEATTRRKVTRLEPRTSLRPPDFAAWAAEHMPDEHPGLVRAAAAHVWLGLQKERLPTVPEVRERMAQKGWLS